MAQFKLPQGYPSAPPDYKGEVYLESQVRAAFKAGLEAQLDDVSDRFAARLALELECMLLDPGSFWESAAKVLEEYKQARELANPSPPTCMGEPV